MSLPRTGLVQLGPGLHFYGKFPNSDRYVWTHLSCDMYPSEPLSCTALAQTELGCSASLAGRRLGRLPTNSQPGASQRSGYVQADGGQSISSVDKENFLPMEPSIRIVGDLRKPVLPVHLRQLDPLPCSWVPWTEPASAVGVHDQRQSCHLGLDESEMVEHEWMCEFER